MRFYMQYHKENLSIHQYNCPVYNAASEQTYEISF